MVTDRCPHCDSLVSISIDREGNPCYVSLAEKAIREVLTEQERLLRAERIGDLQGWAERILLRGLEEESP